MFCGNIGCRICLIIEVFMWRNGWIVIGLLKECMILMNVIVLIFCWIYND